MPLLYLPRGKTVRVVIDRVEKNGDSRDERQRFPPTTPPPPPPPPHHVLARRQRQMCIRDRLEDARQDKIENSKMLRIDSTVTESTIHDPTDGRLLWEVFGY